MYNISDSNLIEGDEERRNVETRKNLIDDCYHLLKSYK